MPWRFRLALFSYQMLTPGPGSALLSVLLPPGCRGTDQSHLPEDRYCIWAVVIPFDARLPCGHSFTRGYPTFMLLGPRAALAFRQHPVLMLKHELILYWLIHGHRLESQSHMTPFWPMRCKWKLMGLPGISFRWAGSVGHALDPSKVPWVYGALSLDHPKCPFMCFYVKSPCPMLHLL